MITRETDYALRLLRTLRDGERRTAAEAAERELVPQSFAHKILKKLARAGFVEVGRSVRLCFGRHGNSPYFAVMVTVPDQSVR